VGKADAWATAVLTSLVRKTTGRQLLGPANPILIAFSVSLVAAAFVYGWAWLTRPPHNASAVLSGRLRLAVIVVMCVIGPMTGVTADGRGVLHVLGYFLMWRIPASQVGDVAIGRGLKVIKVSGRKIGTVAYGYTATAEYLKYKRATQAQKQIEAFLRSHTTGEQSLGDRVSVRLRWQAMSLAVAAGAVLLGGAFLINFVRVR